MTTVKTILKAASDRLSKRDHPVRQTTSNRVGMLLCCIAFAYAAAPACSDEAEPFGRGPYTVGSTNMEVAPDYADIGDDAMHEFLLGRTTESGEARYIADILKHPDSAWITNVRIPDDKALYGPASGLSLPVVTFLTFPSSTGHRQSSYAFPYHAAEYGVFEDMLAAGEAPGFADPETRYPLIVLAHGAPAHGIYDVRHAHLLASHGYIVAVINYGDERTAAKDGPNPHVGFLRPLLTKAVLDSLLDSDAFGANIDAGNIGITGHSYGGFTALAVTGGPFEGNTATVSDARIKAGVIAAPWVGGNYDGDEVFAFGPGNTGLNRVTAPMLCLFGSKDEVTQAAFILPAMRHLAGPTYVVELVDQPHIFEQGSWDDRNGWELLFFSAYLKNDPTSLAVLRTARSMRGGNEDRQLFDYQSPGAR
ncbi:MAG: alpha/beta fold hydrolase [Pseudomonadota bacterium]